MEHYVVTVELDRRTPKEDHELDTIMEAVAPLHGALSTGDAGGLTISVTVPGEDLRQAVTIGLAATAEHGTPVGLTALPERVRDARDGWPAVPELVGATAAADMLKVSRQQVWNLIEGGSLPGQRVGRDWVIPAAAVRALVEERSAGA